MSAILLSSDKPDDIRLLLSKPLRETFDVEAIKREQHWQGQHDKLAMMQLIEEMGIEEPIETLLAQLTK